MLFRSRWADAIVISEGAVLIIESKLRADPGALGQLELYKKLFVNTPEFSQYANWPIQLVLLCAVTDLNMVELCSEKGVTFEVFSEEDVNAARKKMMLPVL